MFRVGRSFLASKLASRRARLSLRNSQCAAYATVFPGKEYQAGDKVSGYTVVKAQTVPTFCARATHLVHDKTGAEHLHVARDDGNNTFGVALRTTPMDSTGVPHILEHSTLCGSEKYPVRSLFFKMMSRSLATFTNAFTGPDWTMYPFCTQNAQDYRNLLSVYLNAVFFPRLLENDFRQEGWRLEHSDPADKTSPIVFKGVVYNEMKGVYDNYLLEHSEMSHLLPDHTYAHMFGGDPEFIPDLSWETLRRFHSVFYHPSNAKFYTYGTFPLEEHLEQIETQVLDKFEKINPKTDVPLQTKWSSPREVNVSCLPRTDAQFPDKQTKVSVSYLCNDVNDRDESFTMYVLGELLLQGFSAPFYRSLCEPEPKIGSRLTTTSGYHVHSRNARFSVGLEDVHPSDTDRVKQLIEETFQAVAEGEGLGEDRIETVLQGTELSMKSAQDDQFGLQMFMGVICKWNHGADPVHHLCFDEQLAAFRQRIAANPDYLKEKVREYFLENPHKLTVVMTPDSDLEEKRKQKEVDKLNLKMQKLSNKQKNDVYQQGVELIHYQNLEEDLSCLPSLQVSDIEREVKRISFDHIKADGVSVQRCEQPTNGITYFKALINTRDLPAQLKPYLPLFCEVLTSTGVADMNYRELRDKVNLYTGGLDASPGVFEHHTDTLIVEEGLLLSSYCLDKNVPRMLELWEKVFNTAELWNEDRVSTIVREKAADMQLAQLVSQMGHVLAKMISASHLSPTGKLTEVYSGVTQASVIRRFAETQDWLKIICGLEEIGEQILNTNDMRVAITCTPESMTQVTAETEKFLSSLKRSREDDAPFVSLSHISDFKPTPSNLHLPIESRVHYIGTTVKTVPYTHEDYASLAVLSSILTDKYLHREVREKGGAYGAGCLCEKGELFSFLSFADPNTTVTVDKFKEASLWAARGEFTQADIDEAKLKYFAQEDSPIPPNMAGMRHFIRRIDHDTHQQIRTRVLNVDKEQLVRAAHTYILHGKHGATTVIGNRNTDLSGSGYIAIEYGQ